MRTCIIWSRQDLRIDDNPAFSFAQENGYHVVPVYIYAPKEEGEWTPGAASRVFLHHSLEAFRAELEEAGLKLIIRKGPSISTLVELIEETGAEAVFWNRRYEPQVIWRDSKIKEDLKAMGVEARSFNASLLHEPWKVATNDGKPYKVYTPFRKRVEQMGFSKRVWTVGPFDQSDSGQISSVTVDDLDLLPAVGWNGKLENHWSFSRKDILNGFRQFVANDIFRYHERRDLPAIEGTSRLSPYLHLGRIGPREVWQLAAEAEPSRGRDIFMSEVLWREFAYHVLYHFPDTAKEPLRPEFKRFPWRESSVFLQSWQKGRTGYPIVDAGLRELWETGWMHNRVRMIVGSFLVKHLRQHWLHGARWFWDTLVDADLANNTLGWQWAAGCGADAAPYFRIFNPMLQGAKFDPDGAYVRRWVPELRDLPERFIHTPWEAPSDVLKSASVVLGKDYPYPLVEHSDARAEALYAFERLKSGAA